MYAGGKSLGCGTAAAALACKAATAVAGTVDEDEDEDVVVESVVEVEVEVAGDGTVVPAALLVGFVLPLAQPTPRKAAIRKTTANR